MKLDVFAMDTYMTVTAYGADDALMTDVENEIRRIESALSVTIPESEIFILNREGTADVSDTTLEIISGALEVCSATDGALDISIYPVVREWGFTTGEYKVPDGDTIEALLKKVDYTGISVNGNTVALEDGMMVDLGSVVKGYLGDDLVSVLRDHGIKSAILDLGGNVQALGCRPDGEQWKVAVRSPDHNGYLGTVLVSDETVITSGGYERYFEEDGKTYWHIIDPSTGYPAESGLVSVTVIGKEGLRSDALSTALFVMGYEKSFEFWKENRDFEMILVTDNDEVYITSGLCDRFTLSDESPYELKVIEDDKN